MPYCTTSRCAHLFHSGNLCGVTRFAAPDSGGQLHLVQRGELEVQHPDQAALHIGEPSLLFYPRPLARRFVSDTQAGATLACAQLQFDRGANNPLAGVMPDVVCVPLKLTADVVGYGSEAALAHAFKADCGQTPRAWRLAQQPASLPLG
ncbi:cupin domain-containing protein [Aquitalea sp. LB_tupeE]|uniref:cupin domain-containing protein n=1 Tax=Aquitalea sp. LB_tupeE TaxID=2748078 RepID=UPI0015C184A9|nr:cupin domain-containing protein [Aquitalea sp. LB_tupeE]NWK79202.1 helix-turn-helix transcriptional regulator [Aquitalea sp. LB_tupeE]